MTTEKGLTQDQLDVLETLVDTSSLKEVLSGLASICSLKADHLSTNWQDEQSAKVWESASMRLERLTTRIERSL